MSTSMMDDLRTEGPRDSLHFFTVHQRARPKVLGIFELLGRETMAGEGREQWKDHLGL